MSASTRRQADRHRRTLRGARKAPASAARSALIAVLAAPVSTSRSGTLTGILQLAADILVPIFEHVYTEVDSLLWAWLDAELGSRTILFATPSVRPLTRMLRDAAA